MDQLTYYSEKIETLKHKMLQEKAINQNFADTKEGKLLSNEIFNLENLRFQLFCKTQANLVA